MSVQNKNTKRVPLWDGLSPEKERELIAKGIKLPKGVVFHDEVKGKEESKKVVFHDEVKKVTNIKNEVPKKVKFQDEVPSIDKCKPVKNTAKEIDKNVQPPVWERVIVTDTNEGSVVTNLTPTNKTTDQKNCMLAKHKDTLLWIAIGLGVYLVIK